MVWECSVPSQRSGKGKRNGKPKTGIGSKIFYREALSEFNVEEADNGFEAVEKLGEKSYEIVLLDINIPFYNGIEVLKKIKEMNIDVKVIVLSAYGAKKLGQLLPSL